MVADENVSVQPVVDLEPIIDIDAWDYEHRWDVVSRHQDACRQWCHVGLSHERPASWVYKCKNWGCMRCALERVGRYLAHFAKAFRRLDFVYVSEVNGSHVPRIVQYARSHQAEYLRVRRQDGTTLVLSNKDLAGPHSPRWESTTPLGALTKLREVLRLPGLSRNAVKASKKWTMPENNSDIEHLGIIARHRVDDWIAAAEKNPDSVMLRQYALSLGGLVDSEVDEM